MVKQILERVSKKIENPNSEEISLGRKTVFDSWLKETAEDGSARPYHQGIDGSSDFAPFIYKLGIPTLEFTFTVSFSILAVYID